MQQESDYISLLKVFAHVLEANKGTIMGSDDKILDAEGLAAKCFFHASSFLYLLRSTNVPELGISFFDPASMNVVARAALESFLVFHYVFVEPDTEEDKDFRYLSWKLADLKERQKYEAMSPQGKVKQEQEQKAIEEIIKKISTNQYYTQIKSKHQRDILGGRAWRLKSWIDIGLSTGLSEDYAISCYRFLCSYAHAGSMSVLQIRQAKTAKQQKALCGATMALGMITMAFFVKSYCSLFEKSQHFLDQHDEPRTIIKMWVEIGSTQLKSVEVDWGREDVDKKDKTVEAKGNGVRLEM